jgi:hypothetical protein
LLFNGAVSVYGVDDGVINEYGAGGGIKIGRGNRSIRRKLAPVQFCHHTATSNPAGRDLESKLGRAGGKQCYNSGRMTKKITNFIT